MSQHGELVDHLFRHQSGKMLATLVRLLGPGQIQVAEDVVQDVLCRALETWKFGRLPRNPEAWLMQAAKNRAIDLLRHGERVERLEPALRHSLGQRELEASFQSDAVGSGVLQLAFSCCDAALSEDTQVTVILKYLGGFSVKEIAGAFLTSADTIEKRLGRGRAALCAHARLYDFESASDWPVRLASVLRALYLLFNEGYHGANEEEAVRGQLCFEALRLGLLVARDRRLGTPDAKALVALMCLHGARLGARVADDRSLITLAEQDRSRWHRPLLAEGLAWLSDSAQGEAASEYHLEAAIAGHHAVASSVAATDWAEIRTLYDALYQRKPTAVVALNRAIAISMAEGPQAGVAALSAIAERDRLAAYPFYAAALGDCCQRLGELERARAHFTAALSSARNPKERELFEHKLLGVASVA